MQNSRHWKIIPQAVGFVVNGILLLLAAALISIILGVIFALILHMKYPHKKVGVTYEKSNSAVCFIIKPSIMRL